jgi:hypothetical protein
MRCRIPNCNAELDPGDMFCGRCGLPVSTYQSRDVSETSGDLFPLFGVTLGETTVDQLARLGKRSSMINKNTGRPYEYYEINKINFWYQTHNIAETIYIARGIHPIPEPWNALGFDWNISYNQWVGVLQRLGYSVTIVEPPKIVEYEGHNSFSAQISASKQARIPIEIQLNFNYNQGISADSQGTVYGITVKALNDR